MNSYTAVASLAEMSHAIDMEHRMTAVESILPTLVTKAEFNKAIGDLQTNIEKGQKENRAWMLATVLGLVAGFGAVFYSVQSSTAQNIDRMDRRIERMDERIERMDQRINQFQEFLQSQRSGSAPAPSAEQPEPNPARPADSSE